VATGEWPAEISHTNEQIITTTAAAAAAAKQAASAPAARRRRLPHWRARLQYNSVRKTGQ